MSTPESIEVRIVEIYKSESRGVLATLIRLLGDFDRAIAVGMRDGPEAGLVIIDKLIESGTLDTYHQAHAAQADLARRLGFLDEAMNSYRRAIELVRQEPERQYIEGQLAEISEQLHPICPFERPPFD